MTERIKAKDFRGGLFVGGVKGPQIIEPKERNISKAIANFLDKKGIYNDRLNSGMFQMVTSYIEKKTGNKKNFGAGYMAHEKERPIGSPSSRRNTTH
jgi:hypothetical protein